MQSIAYAMLMSMAKKVHQISMHNWLKIIDAMFIRTATEKDPHYS